MTRLRQRNARRAQQRATLIARVQWRGLQLTDEPRLHHFFGVVGDPAHMRASPRCHGLSATRSRTHTLRGALCSRPRNAKVYRDAREWLRVPCERTRCDSVVSLARSE